MGVGSPVPFITRLYMLWSLLLSHQTAAANLIEDIVLTTHKKAVWKMFWIAIAAASMLSLCSFYFAFLFTVTSLFYLMKTSFVIKNVTINWKTCLVPHNTVAFSACKHPPPESRSLLSSATTLMVHICLASSLNVYHLFFPSFLPKGQALIFSHQKLHSFAKLLEVQPAWMTTWKTNLSCMQILWWAK